MFTAEASRQMFHINRELDYDKAIDNDRHESWGGSPLYPAIVRLHTEMPAQSVPLHWHLGAELVYVRHGAVRMFIDGEQTMIGDGQVALVSPKALHSIHPMPYDHEQNVLSISFDGEYLARMSPGLAGLRLVQSVAIGGDDSPSAERLVALCEQVADCIDAEDADVRLLRLNALLYALLCQLIEDWRVPERGVMSGIAGIAGVGAGVGAGAGGSGDAGGSGSGNAGAGDGAVPYAGSELYAITAYMEAHYASGMTVGQIARHFGYSREYFSRMFKRGAGVTPDRYLTEMRVQSAVDDLLGGGETVAAIAQRNGFASARSMSHAFTARFSMTPAAFRRVHGKFGAP